MSRKGRLLTIEIVSVALSIILFWVPLYFVILTALKNPQEAARMNLDWPTEIRLWQNIKEVFVFRDYMLVRAFW
ncbi:MAG: ABC transporter, partial [Paenibacillaceae bacterium]